MGTKLQLFTRNGTKLSGPLKQAINDGVIIQRTLNPDTTDDSYLIIELLGKVKKEECYKCLLKTIKS